MNWAMIEAEWTEIKELALTRWQRLTPNDLDAIGGKRERLARTIQERYGWTPEHVEVELEEFAKVPLLNIEDFLELEDSFDFDDVFPSSLPLKRGNA